MKVGWGGFSSALLGMKGPFIKVLSIFEFDMFVFSFSFFFVRFSSFFVFRVSVLPPFLFRFRSLDLPCFFLGGG